MNFGKCSKDITKDSALCTFCRAKTTSNAKTNTSSDDFNWSVLDSGTVRIDKYTGNGERVVIPAEIDGKSVTDIGIFAFNGCLSLTYVNLPDSLMKIGNHAFCDCESLTFINIPDSVTEIGKYAFCDCESLESINIHNGVNIGEGAFIRTPLDCNFWE